MQRADIAIIGHGFSGGVLLANLVRQAQKSLHIRIYDPSAHAGVGLAYATQRTEHWLNVRANQMGAFADDIAGFWHWLDSAVGRAAIAARRYDGPIAPDAFAPRCLYGDYLRMIQRDTLALAAQKQISIEPIRAAATALAPDETGWKITHASGTDHAHNLVLATGNPFGDSMPRANYSRAPWFADFESLAATPPARMVIIGTGLTALDTIFSLLKSGYSGPIECVSRRGWFPLPHPDAPLPPPDAPAFNPNSPLRLSGMAKALRTQSRHVPWQAAIDRLRPHLATIWRGLSDRDRSRFLTRYFTVWNIHRHRLAPELDACYRAAIATGQLRLIRGRFGWKPDGTTYIRQQGESLPLDGAMIFDCSGPSYRQLPACAASLVAQTIAEPHATGAGLREYAPYRISAATYPAAYAMGTLLLGERLETTAVPELRQQAADIATILLK